jgi:hypothetical protein
MNETIEQTVKTEKPKKNKSVKKERQIVESPLFRMYGLLKGKLTYESDDIFYAYKFNNQ